MLFQMRHYVFQYSLDSYSHPIRKSYLLLYVYFTILSTIIFKIYVWFFIHCIFLQFLQFCPISFNVLGIRRSSPTYKANRFSQRSFKRVCDGLECGRSAFFESFSFESLAWERARRATDLADWTPPTLSGWRPQIANHI